MADIKKKPEELDIFESVDSLDAYFDKLEEGYKDFKQFREKIEKEIAANQIKNIAEAFEKERALAIKLKLVNEANTDELIKFEKTLRYKLLKEQEKEQRASALKIAKEQAEAYLERVYGKKTASVIKQEAEDRRSRHDDNVALVQALKEIPKDKRTTEQKEALAQAKEELRADRLEKSFDNLIKSLDNLNAGIDKYSSYAGRINARLQGYDVSGLRGGSSSGLVSFTGSDIFTTLETRLTDVVGIQPYFRTEEMLDNLQALVETGIASNVEQRAFLQTAKDDIATTFDANNATLLRIIRLQQQDSTAARLGMEAYLTRFLNTLESNTEYLNSTFDSVADALIEASSTMGSEASAEFEYVIQKWLGALTGVGLSENTATNIAQAVGYLGSGNIEALSGTNLQNLLVMAASRSGTISYADILERGLTADTANALMRSIVDYMIEIGGADSNVTRSQFAQTFGISVSDLRAAQQLQNQGYLSALNENFLTYGDMYSELSSQLSAIPGRLNVASLIDTFADNLEFSLATNIAKNPVLASIWKVTDIIQSNTGGINIPFVSTLFGGVDLETTVENLVKLGVVGTSTLGMIGDIVGGLQSTFSPASLLGRLEITADNSLIQRGTGLRGSDVSGLQVSESAFTKTAVSASGQDIYESSLASAYNKPSEQLAQTNEETNYTKQINDYLRDEFREKFNAMTALVDSINRNIEQINNTVADVPVKIEESTNALGDISNKMATWGY